MVMITHKPIFHEAVSCAFCCIWCDVTNDLSVPVKRKGLSPILTVDRVGRWPLRKEGGSE